LAEVIGELARAKFGFARFRRIALCVQPVEDFVGKDVGVADFREVVADRSQDSGVGARGFVGRFLELEKGLAGEGRPFAAENVSDGQERVPVVGEAIANAEWRFWVRELNGDCVAFGPDVNLVGEVIVGALVADSLEFEGGGFGFQMDEDGTVGN
jgi:hypothetical protein